VSWARRFRVHQYLRGSLWVLPLIGGVLGPLLGYVTVLLDQSVHPPPQWTYTTSTASTVLSAMVGATAALTGFVVTVTVLVVQMATGSFSARYMRLWYRDRLLKALLALLVGTFTFAFALLRRIGNDFVPNIGVLISGVLMLACILLFVVFLDRSLHRLRPVAVAVLVADYVRREFRRHLRGLAAAPDVYWGTVEAGGDPPALVVRSAKPGAIQGVDVPGLMRWVRAHDCLLAIPHTIGDFVPAGARLIEVYGKVAADPAAERELRSMIALGSERTVEQDPAFGVRIIVDIANKALSPAVNDPTTAVQVLDHLGDVLGLIGRSDLLESRWPGRGVARTGLLIFVRRWEDYLSLGVTEIREYGASSIQVMRRMRAMLEELREGVRAENRPAVEDEIARLDATVALTFGGAADRDRAVAADTQGMGGGTHSPI
jgi:uncharacterized membrane protein